MRVNQSRAPFHLSALAACLALSIACGGDDDGMDPEDVNCDLETRADDYFAGIQKDGTTYSVLLMDSMPAPPTRGDNAWTVQVVDGNGTPVDGMSVAVRPFMPDHGHGTPIDAVVTAGATTGEWVLSPVNLWMPGYWEVTLDLDDGGGGAVDGVTFKFCIDP